MKFLREQDIVKRWDEFENGCIPIHYGARVLNCRNIRIWRPP